MKYPIAPNGIFTTIQGEGVMAGEPMIFIRLAGCSIGCPLCDTDYRVDRRLEVNEIMAAVAQERLKTYTPKIWITGGEPFDHDLLPLVDALRKACLPVHIATSGHHPICDSILYRYGCSISVSPHDPAKWVHFAGDELKIVPGLNGFGLMDFAKVLERLHGFRSKWVFPCDGKPETVKECQDFVLHNRGWRMGSQAHKQWGLP